MFVAETPSMSGTESNFCNTARDTFLQTIMEKYGVAGCYVTDIVKERAKPGMPTEVKIRRWRPFLIEEIEIIAPKAIVVLGRRTYEHSFKPFIEPCINKNILVEYVFHYCSQVRRAKFEERFADVMERIRSSIQDRP